LRGNFSNRDGGLFPNQFVNLRVLLDVRHQVTLVPTAALQRGAQGTYVYVLNADRTVSVRTITVGPASRSDIVVEQGLANGDQVVTDGTDKLRDGLAVVLAEGRGSAGSGAHARPGNAVAPPAGDRSAPAPADAGASKGLHQHKHQTPGQESN
jgi:multidrug efflux system membrane fusion protein